MRVLVLVALTACDVADTASEPAGIAVETYDCHDTFLNGEGTTAPVGAIPIAMDCFNEEGSTRCGPSEWEIRDGIFSVDCADGAEGWAQVIWLQ
jgi:hypothetical protein